MKLATAQQMREIDQRAISEFGIPSIDLMENAARCVVEEIVKLFPEPKIFAAVCGPGNNGGDGLAVARMLVQEHAWSGTIWLVQSPDSKPSPDRETNLKLASEINLPIAQAKGDAFTRALEAADLVIDAILGTGSHGQLREHVADAIETTNIAAHKSVVSIDAPSGVDCDTGKVNGPAIHADFTVTLGCSKPGLYLSPGSGCVGDLKLRDDFLPQSLKSGASLPAKVVVTDEDDVRFWLPFRGNTRDANKGKYGSVMILAGSQGFIGASLLASLGAARAGAGTVTLGVPHGLIDIAMLRAAAVVMTRGFTDNGSRQFHPDAIADVVEAVSKMSAVGLGPGIGHKSDDIKQFVLELVKQCDKPMVIDADALTLIAAAGDQGIDALRGRKASTMLTPHPGEMARLLGCSTADVQNDRLAAVKQASEKFNCVALLKGDTTLIAASDGKLAINITGNAGMASGGMGDTLTGIATTFLAQIDDPFHAAAIAAYIHGMAGDIVRDEIGIAGILATDVAEKVPQAITRCGAGGTTNRM